MTKSKTGAIIAVGLLLSIVFFGVSWGEDSLPPPMWIIDFLAEGSSNSLLPAIPGGIFVVTVAHLAPSPEDAVVRRAPFICDPIHFRVDKLKLLADDGSIEVEMGDVQRLPAGQSARLVYPVVNGQSSAIPTYELDLLGFRLRSDRPDKRCNIVASGLFFPDADTTSPTAFSIIPGLAVSPSRDGNRDR